MIRKQIYLTDQLNRRLQRLAEERGVPQAEIIREGLEQYIAQTANQDQQWDDLIREMKQSELREIGWNREQAYEDYSSKKAESGE